MENAMERHDSTCTPPSVVKGAAPISCDYSDWQPIEGIERKLLSVPAKLGDRCFHLRIDNRLPISRIQQYTAALMAEFIILTTPLLNSHIWQVFCRFHKFRSTEILLNNAHNR